MHIIRSVRAGPAPAPARPPVIGACPPAPALLVLLIAVQALAHVKDVNKFAWDELTLGDQPFPGSETDTCWQPPRYDYYINIETVYSSCRTSSTAHTRARTKGPPCS